MMKVNTYLPAYSTSRAKGTKSLPRTAVPANAKKPSHFFAGHSFPVISPEQVRDFLISRASSSQAAPTPPAREVAGLPYHPNVSHYSWTEEAFRVLYPTRIDAALLTPRGQVETLGKVLKACLDDPEGSLPAKVIVALDYEKKPPVEAMRKTLGGMAAKAQSNSFEIRIARRFLGMPGQFPPMELHEDNHQPNRVALSMNIKQVDRQELIKLANFLIKNASYVGDKYE